MADIQHYERVIKPQKGGKTLLVKLILLGIYLLILSVWLVIAVRFTLNAAIVILIPVSLLIAVLLTWKYTNVEYEYSFYAGTLTFSKIYGRTKRRVIFDCELKQLRSVLPYDSFKTKPSDSYKVIEAVPDVNCENPCVCVFEEDESSVYLIIDCDEMSARIFRFFNPTATDRAIFAPFNGKENEKNA